MNHHGLLGRVAVITGAAQGIGQHFARALLAEGMKVVIADINGGRLREAAERLQSPGTVFIREADVTDAASMRDLAAYAAETAGGIDLWVNNAGVTLRRPAEEIAPDEWDRTIDINVKGVFLGSQAAARHMIPSRRGVIINMASIAADRALPARSAYCTSKASVVHLSQSLAYEWGSYGLRVNAIAPGYILTDMTAWLKEDQGARQAIEAQVPLGRLGTMDDLVGPLLFLASDAAAYISGHTLFVDGAWSSR